MHVWPVQDAKARFSELLDTCLRGRLETHRWGLETTRVQGI